jgi:DNA helicase-2/ATP-dependent DNA helicase PcrA
MVPCREQQFMKLTKKQQNVMDAQGHLLVIGGPGSGKTTVSILKAGDIAMTGLSPGQKALFLSFARATVSRVIEAIEHEQQIPRDQRTRIDVDTYHSFFWRILNAHGYLVGLPRNLTILTPPNEAIALFPIRTAYGQASKLNKQEKVEKDLKEENERLRLAIEESRVAFRLFARFAAQILHGSDRIRRLIATKYPVIILDEFQDTDSDQWLVVQALGRHSTMIALADPEQRIYDWLGADPKRLDHFKGAFVPVEVDLSSENHRSSGTDIAIFGNDILKGRFRNQPYVGVTCIVYPPIDAMAWSKLITTTYQARKRLVETGRKDWSLVILVPTKKMTRLVSDCFRNPPAGLQPIHHTAAIDMEAAILGAEVVAFLMQSREDEKGHLAGFIDLMRNYFHGKCGDAPTKKSLEEAQRIKDAYEDYVARNESGKGIRGKSIMVAMLNAYEATGKLKLTGHPDNDWRAVRTVLEQGCCPRLTEVAHEVRNVRLLERGSQLRQALSEDWRENGGYAKALTIVQQAFVQEHFSTSQRPESGVIVMNMHKAKGKQFDEVIVFEGWPKKHQGQIVANPHRIVWSNIPENDNDQARQNLRVSVTRGKSKVTILTPQGDPCILLLNRG